ncbi:MAG: hypothetical protein MZV63_57570 [Marinilabiliales bacterium]|nr:hypothetical protein [Marinilabiliales bacterium]
MERGVDPSTRNNAGDTPLHIAVRTDQTDSSLALLSAGTDIYAANVKESPPWASPWLPPPIPSAGSSRKTSWRPGTEPATPPAFRRLRRAGPGRGLPDHRRGFPGSPQRGRTDPPPLRGAQGRPGQHPGPGVRGRGSLGPGPDRRHSPAPGGVLERPPQHGSPGPGGCRPERPGLRGGVPRLRGRPETGCLGRALAPGTGSGSLCPKRRRPHPLHDASGFGDLDSVRLLLSSGASPNARGTGIHGPSRGRCLGPHERHPGPDREGRRYPRPQFRRRDASDPGFGTGYRGPPGPSFRRGRTFRGFRRQVRAPGDPGGQTFRRLRGHRPGRRGAYRRPRPIRVDRPSRGG